MDDPACNLEKLQATYRHFAAVNRRFSGWEQLYRRYLRPRLQPGQTYTLLDIGFGGGDIPRNLLEWAQQGGVTLEITAIDPDARAAAFARTLPPTEGLRFLQTDTRTLSQTGARFDIVISNHLLHHLSPNDLRGLLADSSRLGQLVLHNDIVRSDSAFLGFALLTAARYPGSLITPDGLTSIRRSYTPAELRARVPEGWQVDRPLRYRLLLSQGL